MSRSLVCRAAAGGALLLLSVAASPAANWTNLGGNAERNCRSSEIGPSRPDLLWSTGRYAEFAWQPMVENDRVFVGRPLRFGGTGDPQDSPIVAMDLNTGRELWSVDLPLGPNEWTSWIAGVYNGRVYASRAVLDTTAPPAPLYGLDAATGAVCWVSKDKVDASGYDGVVFARNGDLIVGSQTNVWRISAATGATVWKTPRVGSVSGNCGVAVNSDAVYFADAAPNFHNKIVRLDLATGAKQYESPWVPGFTLQNSPMVGPDGTIYLARTQNNPAVDFFYAFEDTGSSLVTKWQVPSAWITSSELGVGPDGSVYMIAPGNEIHRLDPHTGATLSVSPPYVADFAQRPHMAIDAEGKVFLSNGSDDLGRVYCYSADLRPLWDGAVPYINQGGPALGSDGTLVVAARGEMVQAYRSVPEPSTLALLGIGALGLLAYAWRRRKGAG